MTIDYKPKLLFIRHLDASFIRRDEVLLSKNFEVVTFRFAVNKGWGIFPELFHQFLFLVKYLKKSSFVFIWFADFHAVLPVLLAKIFGKKSFVVIGGVDAAFDPILPYGTKTRLIGRLSVNLTCRIADQLLPVSEYTRLQLLKNIDKSLAGKSQLIHNCFDPPTTPPSAVKRENKVLTVCLTDKVKTLFVKGVDFYLEVARELPDLTFTIVGVHGKAKQWLEERKPSNLIVMEPVAHEQMLRIMAETKVICQFSRHEAFGLALLEGIAAGCFPVGINNAGTSEILQHTNAILIQDFNAKLGAQAIENALSKAVIDQQAIKNEVLPRFSCSHRLNKLLSVLQM